MALDMLSRLAAVQHGIITHAQARRHGLSDDQIAHRIATSAWTRVHRGVYRVTAAPDSWSARVIAACLSTHGGLASHRSAARLWRLLASDDDPVEVTTGSPRNGHLPGVRLHRCKLLLDQDRSTVGGIPVTGPELTLLHLGSQLPPARIDGLVDEALRRSLTTLPRLRWRLRVLGRRGRNGCGVLREVLDARDPEVATAESKLERAFLRLVRGSGIPGPRPQHLVTTEQGTFVARVDAAWPEMMLAVELDGARFHAPLARWTGDVERQNRLTALGWTVFRFTWWDVHQRGHRVVDTLRRAVSRPATGTQAG